MTWVAVFAVFGGAGCSTASGGGTDTDENVESGSTGGATASGSASQSGTTTTSGASTTAPGSSGSPPGTDSLATSDPTDASTGPNESGSSGSFGTLGGSGSSDGSGTQSGSSTGPQCPAPCDDGLYCNGVETCDPLTSEDETGCVPGVSPCDMDITCDEEADECIESRRIFATSGVFTGALNGINGADTLCQEAADSATLGGDWLAYITSVTEPLDRHTQYDVPYVRIDGTTIADNWADLDDQSIQAAINIDENGAMVTGNAWTGLFQVGGSPMGENACQDWTSAGNCTANGFCGGAGETAAVDDHWDGYFVFNCFDQHHLYCVQQ